MKKTLDYNGRKLSYRDEGNGSVVMFVHGFGETGSVWHHQVEHLKRGFRILIPDLPGSGDSELTDDMSIEGMADAMLFIIQHEKVTQFTMIGHSMGGYITLAFAEKESALLSGFGLFHSTSFADTEEKKATRRKGIEFIRAHGAFEFLKTSTPNLFSQQTRSASPDLLSGFIAGLRNFSADALVSYYEAMIVRPDRTQQLKRATVPVLFIMGEHDNAVPFADSLSQSHLPEESYINILHNSGHMGMLEEPAKSNVAIETFLSRN